MKLSNFKLPAVAVMVLTLLCACAGMSMAADTWVPSFSASERVQFDQKLANKLNQSALKESAGKLDALSRSSNIQYYLVVTMHGDDKAPNNGNFAVWKLNQMVTQWQAQSGFPQNDYCVIMVVYGKTRGVQYAVTGGSTMQKYGLSGDWLDKSGLLSKAEKTYLPNDPGPFATEVATGVNSAISSYNFKHNTLPVLLFLGAIGLVVIGWSVYWFMLRGKTDKELSKWVTIRNNSDQWFDELDEDEANLGFLKNVAAEAEKIGDSNNETVLKFKEQNKQLANIAKRKLALSSLVDGAIALRKGIGCWWPMPFAFYAILRRLTSEKVSVTGAKLSMDQRTLFGASANEENSYTPEELVEGLEGLCKNTHRELKSITDAIRTTKANASKITELLGTATTLKPELDKRQLPFTPYEQRQTKLAERATAVQTLVLTNALAAERESNAIKDGVTKLAADLQLAVKIHDSLPATDLALSEAVQLTTSVRAEKVQLAYPSTAEEPAAHVSAEATFTLAEAHGNPDPFIQQTQTSVAEARESLLAGKLTEAQAAKEAADEAAAKAVAVINKVKTDKHGVETGVPQARTKLSRLKNEIKRAATAVGTLNSDFLPENFAGEPEKLQSAGQVRDGAAEEFSKVRQLYLRQEFIAAHDRLSALDASLQSATERLDEIHARLALLTQKRAHAKSVGSKCEVEAVRIERKAEDESHSTSSETDRALAALQQRVLALPKENEESSTLINWLTQADEADAVLTELAHVDSAIDTQKKAYLSAKTKVGQAQTACKEAQTAVTRNYVLKSAKDKVASARTATANAAADLNTPKSDWAAVLASATEAKELADSAKELADTQVAAAHSALESISRAEAALPTHIRLASQNGIPYDLFPAETVQKKAQVGGSYEHFSQNVNYRTAVGNLAAARTAFENGNYTEAGNYADTAANEATGAVRTAELALAAAIQAAISAYEAEQERIRLQNARTTSSDVGGGNFGGGNFGGGGGGDTGRTQTRQEEEPEDRNPRTAGGGDKDMD